jgi:threonine/homoserine/homoserine lactone efflux protein
VDDEPVWAFTIVKSFGALYLIYLGLRMLLHSATPITAALALRRSDGRAAFVQGMVTNLLNPKVALFFLAFLPQFIDPATSTKLTAFLLLGFTFVITGTIWCLLLAWFAGRISRRLRDNERFSVWLNRALGGLFVALGLRLATTR